MIEILSLPRRPKINLLQLHNVNFRSGLPINSLPGWEHIPLNSKLPMLKCPGDQVIFSKNKIGQSFRHLKHNFDSSCMEPFPEYNPLHDPNLKTFYANERNLKRLRQNGEITTSNDVICNLKAFNAYRQQLHKSQLYYVLQELDRLENDQHDRMLVTNAEGVTGRDHGNLAARFHSYTDIINRKNKLDAERAARFKAALLKTYAKFARISSIREMESVLLEHKKMLNQLKFQHHWDVRTDLERKHFIKLKKLFQTKKERLKRNLRRLHRKGNTAKDRELAIKSWQKRLRARIDTQYRVQMLLDALEKRRKIYVNNHSLKYREKWDKIRDEIDRRARRQRKLHEKKLFHVVLVHDKTQEPKKKKKKKKKKAQNVKKDEKEVDLAALICKQNIENLDHFLDSEMCEVLTAAINMADQKNLTFRPEDPIYKTAEFVMQHIISKFDRDLRDDKIAVAKLTERMSEFLETVKKFIIHRSSQIIATVRLKNKEKEKAKESVGHERPMRGSRVSFSHFSKTIGVSAYNIHPLTELRTVADRKPTPAGSLSSIVVKSRASLLNVTNTEHLCSADLLFIEHYVVKFKRELIVNVGKRVFAAIQCHFLGKIMDVRKEMLEMDQEFIIKQIADAILGYAVNSLNFDTSLNLAANYLSSIIIWDMQKHLLRPERDPRGIVQPRQCCPNETARMRLCLYCHPN